MAQTTETPAPVENNIFDIVSTGSKSDGKTFWSQISKEQDGFVMRAFIVTTTAQTAGTKLTIPKPLLRAINWGL